MFKTVPHAQNKNWQKRLQVKYLLNVNNLDFVI